MLENIVEIVEQSPGYERELLELSGTKILNRVKLD